MNSKSLSDEQTNKYIPGSSEKKRAIMMYLLLGIILSSTSTKLELSIFEFAHFKQALGWRAIFLLILLVNSVILFIPFIRVIPILIILADLILLGIFVKQAWDGRYYVLKQESSLFIFQGIGERIVNIFDLHLPLKQEISPSNESNITDDDIKLE